MLLCLCTGITMKPDNSEAVNLENRYSLENLMGKMGWDFSAINYCCPAGAVCLTAQLQEQTTYVLLTLCKVRELSVNLHRSIWPWGRAVALLSSPLQWGIYSSEGYSSLQHHPHVGPSAPCRRNVGSMKLLPAPFRNYTVVNLEKGVMEVQRMSCPGMKLCCQLKFQNALWAATEVSTACAPLERGLVKGDTNKEKEPVKLVKPRVCQTKGVSDEQCDFASAVSRCFVSTWHTQVQAVPPRAQSNRGNLSFPRGNSGLEQSVPRGSSGKCPYLWVIKGGRDRKHAFKGGVLKKAWGIWRLVGNRYPSFVFTVENCC